jgi:hypothetical protein
MRWAGARTPAFLDSRGYGRPAEDHVGVRLLYSSQLLRLPPGVLDKMAVIITVASAGRDPRAGRARLDSLFSNLFGVN